jgi:hypothetical protein
MQRQMNLSPLKVKQEVSTRWNSCLLMMERLQDIKVPLSAAMSNLSGTPPLLSSDDWAVLKKCTSILKPMEALTTELSGEKYTRMSMIIPLIRGLQLALNNIKPITPIGKKLQQDLRNTISRRFSSLEVSKISSSEESASDYDLPCSLEELVLHEENETNPHEEHETNPHFLTQHE